MNQKLLNLEINYHNNEHIKKNINLILKELKVPNIWRNKVANLINVIEQNAINQK